MIPTCMKLISALSTMHYTGYISLEFPFTVIALSTQCSYILYPPNFSSITRLQLKFSVVVWNMIQVQKRTGRVAGSCASVLASLKCFASKQFKVSRELWKRKATQCTDKSLDTFSFRTFSRATNCALTLQVLVIKKP